VVHRARLFVDFWNFSLNWKDRVANGNCDWTKLPAAVLAECSVVFAGLGIADRVVLEETHVYASVEPTKDAKLKAWLNGWLDRQPSFRVSTRERRSRPFSVRCSACGHESDRCPACRQPFQRAVEKGVDTAIVTDLLSLAWQSAFDVAVLVTSDADFVPAVQRVQEKGLKVINAGWRQHGHELKRACWAAFDLDQVAATICR
jgi:uncharacterized LabA/DUF88 family protein